MNIERQRIRKVLATHYNVEELRVLCFDIGISFDNLPSKTRDGLTADIIEHCERKGLYKNLVQVVEIGSPHAIHMKSHHLEYHAIQKSKARFFYSMLFSAGFLLFWMMLLGGAIYIISFVPSFGEFLKYSFLFIFALTTGYPTFRYLYDDFRRL